MGEIILTESERVLRNLKSTLEEMSPSERADYINCICRAQQELGTDFCNCEIERGIEKSHLCSRARGELEAREIKALAEEYA